MMPSPRYQYEVRELAASFLFGDTSKSLQRELDAAAAEGWRLASTLPLGKTGNPILIVLERPADGAAA